MTCDVWSLIAAATAKLYHGDACYRSTTMIPYDDLVAALSAWRARQGLPVSTMGGAPPTSGSYAAQSSPGAMRPPVPAPLDEPLEVDDAEMVEEQYDDASA